MNTLGQDLAKLRKLKEHERELKARMEDAKREREMWERHCWDRMEGEDTDSQKTGGSLFTRSSTIYATVQDREAFVQWAKSNDPDLVQDKERAGELNALVRACIDDEGDLPPGVGYYSRDIVSVRKA